MTVLLTFVLLPFIASVIITLLSSRLNRVGSILSYAVSAYLLAASLYCLKLLALQGTIVYKLGGWPPPFGITLVLDGLSNFMLVIVNGVAFLSLIYASSYMQRYTDRWKFNALFMLMLTGLNGVILSGDLFNMYIFLELASISGYALVAFGVEPEDLEASFKYAIMGAIASVFILLGIALLYSYTSTLNMADISLVLAGNPRTLLIQFVSVLFLTGFGLKAALVPFHAWLPDAHSCAPTPVSAMLSGVFIKTLGIYALARVFFNVLGVTRDILFVFMVLGSVSMVIGAFLAVAQNDLKRMFAYSSISQVGYIIFALGIGTPLALLGGLFHLFNHAVLKSMLFLNAGSIEYATGTRSLNKLGGLNTRLPVTSLTSFWGALSISGIPPLAGFWSKLIIIIAAVQAGYFGFALIAVLVSILTLVYYLKFQIFAFMGKLNQAWLNIKESPFSMQLPMLILTFICVFGALLLLPGFRGFLQSAVACLTQGTDYKNVVFNLVR